MYSQKIVRVERERYLGDGRLVVTAVLDKFGRRTIRSFERTRKQWEREKKQGYTESE